MSNTKSYAENELNILVKSCTDPGNRPVIEEFIPEILALVDKFGESDQSGGSAPFTATAISQVVKHLCLQEPICPVIGIEEEWYGVDEINKVYQNSRCSALFKLEDNKSYYLDAIAWKDQKGNTWSGTALLPTKEIVYSRQYVKGFPFIPKTFIVDVIEKEIAKDDWEFYVKDEKQLDEVFEYYDKFVIVR